MAEDTLIRCESSSLLPDDRIAELAAVQHGVVARWQLLALGLTPRQIQIRVERGRLFGIHRGVYSVGHRAITNEALEMAAVLVVGGDAVVSHAAAARRWSLPRQGRWRLPIDVSTTKRIRGRYAGVRIHQVRTLDASDIDVRDGIPITSVERTIVDLAATSDPWRLTHLMHEAEYHDRFNRAVFSSILERVRTRDGTTHAVASRALAMLRAGSAGTRSALEERFLRALLRAGLPEPLVNVRVAVSGGSIEVDLHWPHAALCVEVDGMGHRRQRTRRADLRRDARLRAAGLRVVRVDVVEIDADIRAAVDRVRQALAAQR